MTEKVKKQVYAYYRTSSDLQEKRQSWESQKLACEEWAEKNDIEILKEFIDFVSAYKTRPQFNNLLLECEKNPEITGILVFDFDRLLRDQVTYMQVCTTLAPLKQVVYQVTGPEFDPNVDENVMSKGIVTYVKEYETKMTKKRQRSGIHRKIRNGEEWGRPKVQISKAKLEEWITKDENGNDKFIVKYKKTIADALKISTATLNNRLREHGYGHMIAAEPTQLIMNRGKRPRKVRI
ncbi:MAG: recombinase family protein [Candidatus Heimdallarchaeota archaeon]|nr:recombinase family protein [Candidatus Heimdallarchaeota archaeon]